MLVQRQPYDGFEDFEQMLPVSKYCERPRQSIQIAATPILKEFIEISEPAKSPLDIEVHLNSSEMIDDQTPSLTVVHYNDDVATAFAIPTLNTRIL